MWVENGFIKFFFYNHGGPPLPKSTTAPTFCQRLSGAWAPWFSTKKKNLKIAKLTIFVVAKIGNIIIYYYFSHYFQRSSDEIKIGSASYDIFPDVKKKNLEQSSF